MEIVAGNVSSCFVSKFGMFGAQLLLEIYIFGSLVKHGETM